MLSMGNTFYVVTLSPLEVSSRFPDVESDLWFCATRRLCGILAFHPELFCTALQIIGLLLP